MKSGSKGSQIEESEVYEFGPYRLDAGERILLLDGRTVALTPKALDTLIVLVRNQPQGGFQGRIAPGGVAWHLRRRRYPGAEHHDPAEGAAASGMD